MAAQKKSAGAKTATPPKNKYLSIEAVRQATKEAIARLELDRHNVELAIIVHGEDVLISEGETAKQAIKRISAKIKEIETTYASVLSEDEEN